MWIQPQSYPHFENSLDKEGEIIPNLVENLVETL
jgi:hypothetical protein